jgi:hypothetical protein
MFGEFLKKRLPYDYQRHPQCNCANRVTVATILSPEFILFPLRLFQRMLDKWTSLKLFFLLLGILIQRRKLVKSNKSYLLE